MLFPSRFWGADMLKLAPRRATRRRRIGMTDEELCDILAELLTEILWREAHDRDDFKLITKRYLHRAIRASVLTKSITNETPDEIAAAFYNL
jgi:hypothetical protein